MEHARGVHVVCMGRVVVALGVPLGVTLPDTILAILVAIVFLNVSSKTCISQLALSDSIGVGWGHTSVWHLQYCFVGLGNSCIQKLGV